MPYGNEPPEPDNQPLGWEEVRAEMLNMKPHEFQMEYDRLTAVSPFRDFYSSPDSDLRKAVAMDIHHSRKPNNQR